MRLPAPLLKRLNLQDAIKGEVADPPDRLPSIVAETALGNHAEAYEKILRTRLRREQTISRHELIWVPKARIRYRGVSALPLEERLLYRSLILDIEKELEESLSVPPKSEFEEALLAETTDPYIARTDVSSYYNYIDHALVHERIIEEAARADTAEVTVELLQSFLGRAFGIPQNVGASEVIGELILLPVVDRLARAGITAYRRNDDFYLPCASWSDAVAAIEALQAELYALGLSLNEEKTRVWKRETLESNIGRVGRRLRELLEERSLDDSDVGEVDEYTGDVKGTEGASENGQQVAQEDVVEVSLRLLTESLAEWRGRPADEEDEPEAARDPAVAKSAILAMLRLLGRHESPAALEYGVQILRTDPGMTQAYVLAYLNHLPGDVDVPSHLEAIVDEIGPIAPAWQQAWLMDALLDLQRPPTKPLVEWLTSFLQSQNPAPLRVRALLVLGLHDLIEPIQISRHFDTVPPVARPDVAAAMAVRVADQADSSLRPIRRAGPLYTWIVDDVIDALPDTTLL